MGGACGTYQIEEKYVQSFGGKTLKEIDHLEDICRDGRIILKCVLKKKEGRVWNLFTCAGMGQLWGLEDTVTNFWVQ